MFEVAIEHRPQNSFITGFQYTCGFVWVFVTNREKTASEGEKIHLSHKQYKLCYLEVI